MCSNAVPLLHMPLYSANKNGGAHLETSHKSFVLSTILFAGNYFATIGK